MKELVQQGNAKILKVNNSAHIFSFAFLTYVPKQLHHSSVTALKYLLVLFFFCQINYAQEDSEITAPPPLKIISKAEKSRLEAETDIKRRTILSIELMEAKLLKAEGFSAAEDYPSMFAELGSFHALLDDTIDFLSDKNAESGKVLNNFKRVELTLRKYITRIELIRRDLPVKYEWYVKKLVRYVRDARSKAVEPLFDDTVVPEKKPV